MFNHLQVNIGHQFGKKLLVLLVGMLRKALMENIEDIKEVSRLAIQAKVKNAWFTVHNFPIGTDWRIAIEDLKNWKNDEPNSTFRLICTNIIVETEIIAEL